MAQAGWAGSNPFAGPDGQPAGYPPQSGWVSSNPFGGPVDQGYGAGGQVPHSQAPNPFNDLLGGPAPAAPAAQQATPGFGVGGMYHNPPPGGGMFMTTAGTQGGAPAPPLPPQHQPNPFQQQQLFEQNQQQQLLQLLQQQQQQQLPFQQQQAQPQPFVQAQGMPLFNTAAPSMAAPVFMVPGPGPAGHQPQPPSLPQAQQFGAVPQNPWGELLGTNPTTDTNPNGAAAAAWPGTGPGVAVGTGSRTAADELNETLAEFDPFASKIKKPAPQAPQTLAAASEGTQGNGNGYHSGGSGGSGSREGGARRSLGPFGQLEAEAAAVALGGPRSRSSLPKSFRRSPPPRPPSDEAGAAPARGRGLQDAQRSSMSSRSSSRGSPGGDPFDQDNGHHGPRRPPRRSNSVGARDVRAPRGRPGEPGEASEARSGRGSPGNSVAEDDEEDDDDDDDDGDEVEFEPQPGGGGGGAAYEVTFPAHERKLGMLLERHDEWEAGNEARCERAIVKMVVDSGPAKMRGVTVGSKVVAVNGHSINGLTYQETLTLMKDAPRPLRVSFVCTQAVDENNVGYCLFKKTVGVPRQYRTWQRKYYVLGGAVAKPNMLQLYTSKQSYDRVVLSVFSKKQRRVLERVKAYRLNKLFKCGPIKVKKYTGVPIPIKYFVLKAPKTHLKQINFASDAVPELEHLRNMILKYATRA